MEHGRYSMRKASKSARPFREPTQAQKERMEKLWRKKWDNVIFLQRPPGNYYLEMSKTKPMLTYKHKPSNSFWDLYLVEGKEVLINQTDAWAVREGKENITMIPKGIAINGFDWERLEVPLTIQDFERVVFSYNDIMVIAEDNGHHYRQFQTKDLLDALKSKLCNV